MDVQLRHRPEQCRVATTTSPTASHIDEVAVVAALARCDAVRQPVTR